GRRTTPSGQPGRTREESGTRQGEGVGVVGAVAAGAWSTLTSLNGSSRSARGNTTKNSSASTPASSTRQPASLPGRPPGNRRQIQTYISAHQRRGRTVGLRLLRRQLRVHDDALRSGVLRVAGRERQQPQRRFLVGIRLVRH